MNAQQQAIVRAAADRWAEVVTQDLPDFTVPQTIDFCGAGGTFPNIPAGTLIDDLLVQVTGTTQIGGGNALGGSIANAGPCGFIVPGDPIIRTARIGFDPIDLATFTDEELFVVTLHEMGHTQGIGTNWSQFEVGDPVIAYNGPRATAEYNNLLGNPGGTVLPPLQQGGGHWDEPIFGNELMTPSITLGFGDNPLSQLSAGSLDDIGFLGVDFSSVDSYGLPVPLTQGLRPQGTEVDMGNDAVIGPLMDLDGRMVMPFTVVR